MREREKSCRTPRRLSCAPGLAVLMFPEIAESGEQRTEGKSKVTLWVCHVCDDCKNSKGRCQVDTDASGSWLETRIIRGEFNRRTIYKGVSGV